MAKRKAKKKGKDLLKWPRVILPILFAAYLIALRFVLEPHSDSNWLTYFLVENAFLLMVAYCLMMTLLSIRRWKFFLVWIVLLAGEIFLGGHPNFGSRSTDIPAKSLKVLTYNVAHFEVDKPGVIQVLKDSQADLIFIQEACKPEEEKSTGEALCRDMKGYHYVVASSNMIVSRYPIKLEKIHNMPTKWPFKKFPEAVVETPLGKIRVMCVHMEPSWVEKIPPDFGEYIPIVGKVVQDRRAQADIVLASLRPSKEPVILAGDFNGTPDSECLHRVSEYFTDSYATTEKGFGFTLLPKLPYKRIDYVWTRGLTPIQSEVIDSKASDHMPVLTKLGK